MQQDYQLDGIASTPCRQRASAYLADDEAEPGVEPVGHVPADRVLLPPDLTDAEQEQRPQRQRHHRVVEPHTVRHVLLGKRSGVNVGGRDRNGTRDCSCCLRYIIGWFVIVWIDLGKQK